MKHSNKNILLKYLLFITLTISILYGCSAAVGTTDISSTPSSVSPAFSTATLYPTFTPRPSPTKVIPTITPTSKPVTGTSTSQVNIRSGPEKSALSLGLLQPQTRVTITGRNPDSTWLQILIPENSVNLGWVTVQYITVDGEVGQIPVVNPDLPQTETPVINSPDLTPTNTPPTAKLLNQVNIRKGPGQIFESLGLLEPGLILNLLGRNQNSTWYLVSYPASPDGKGWVASAYIDIPKNTNLPYYDNQGNLLSGSVQSPPSSSPSLTPTPENAALDEGDSSEKPAASIVFSPDDVKEFSYTSDLSSPSGDHTDWINFTPYEPNLASTYVYLRLDCTGNGGITGTVELNGIPLDPTRQLHCGNYDFAIKVIGGQEYQLVLTADGSGSVLRYTKYTLAIQTQLK